MKEKPVSAFNGFAIPLFVFVGKDTVQLLFSGQTPAGFLST
jgi:hypothetical protein